MNKALLQPEAMRVVETVPQTTQRLIRVAYVVHTFDMGGLERFISRLANGLDRERFQPLIICLNRNGTAAAWLESADIPVIELHKRRGNDLRLLPRFARVLRDQRVDIVQSHNWGTLLESLAARRLARTPVHFHAERGTIGGTLKNDWKARLRRMALRWAARRVSGIITNAASIRNRLRAECGIPEQKVTVIANGVPRLERCLESRAAIRQRLGIAETAFVAGSIGRLVGVKDFPNALNAMGRLVQNGCGLHFILVGDGPDRPALESQIRQLGLDSHVHLVGEQTDIASWLSAFDAYVNCSVSEGMSQAIIEAIALGLPLVVTDVGDNAAIVSKSEPCGIVVPASDCVALAEALERLASDASLRERLAVAAQRRFESNHSLPAMLEAYNTLYSTLFAAAHESRTEGKSGKS
jgi:glycosyltransferase involved in cell wall biosynthesis